MYSSTWGRSGLGFKDTISFGRLGRPFYIATKSDLNFTEGALLWSIARSEKQTNTNTTASPRDLGNTYSSKRNLSAVNGFQPNSNGIPSPAVNGRKRWT